MSDNTEIINEQSEWGAQGQSPDWDVWGRAPAVTGAHNKWRRAFEKLGWQRKKGNRMMGKERWRVKERRAAFTFAF